MAGLAGLEMDIFKCFVDSSSPLSAVTVAKRLGIKRSQVLKYVTKASFIERVEPHEVGSGKMEVNVFKYTGDK